MKIYQQVRRRSFKVEVVVELAKIKKVSAVVTVVDSSLSSVSSLTGFSGVSNNTSDQNSTWLTVASSPELAPGATSMVGVGNKKKSRATSKEVQKKHAVKASRVQRNKLAMKQATVLIVRNASLPARHQKSQVAVDPASNGD
jgi:hypothetical protein